MPEHLKPMPVNFNKYGYPQGGGMSDVVCLQPEKHDIPAEKATAAMSDPTTGIFSRRFGLSTRPKREKTEAIMAEKLNRLLAEERAELSRQSAKRFFESLERETRDRESIRAEMKITF